MAYRRRTRRRGTRAGQVRKTARRAYRRNTTAGQKRKTARRAYRRRNPSNPRKGDGVKRPKKGTLSIKKYTTDAYWRRKRAKSNPRRRRRRKTRRTARRRVSYRRNPLGQIQQAFTDIFSMDTFEQVAQTGLGFAGAVAGTNLLVEQLGVDALKEGWGKVGATAGVAALESGLLHMITKDARLSKRVLVGGMLATLLRALGQVIPADSEMRKWVPTLGNRNGQFRRAIERQVLREMRGSGQGAYYMPASGSSGLNSYYMPAAGSSAYLTPYELRTAENRSGFAGLGAYLTQKQGSEIDQYGFAGMGYKGTVSEFGNAGAVRERF